MNPFMVAATAVRSTELCHNVIRPEVGDSGERKRQTSSASCAKISKQLIRSCASVPACQDCGRSAMDPSRWNHQEPGVIDFVSGQHPMLQNVPWE